MQIYATLFFVSFIFCIVIILAGSYGFSRRAELDEVAIQSAHTGFVPRVGGLAIFISLLGLIPFLSLGFVPLTIVFDLNVEKLTWLILSTVPVFSVGLMEDLGYAMSPRTRMIASAISGLCVIFVFKTWLSQLGVPGIDELLLFAPFAILFTLFATVGVVNSFNLIDGLHGLSGYVTISIAASLSIIAFNVGDIQLAIFLVLLISAVLGFFLLNFPFGKIFLGDGGAYALGHLLVWSAILLVSQDAEISSFSILLIFFWPVADTGLAIWRRWKLGNPTNRPDRLHFHQLAMRFIEIRFFGRDRRGIVNPLSTVILTPMVSAPQVLGICFWNDFRASVLCTVGMGLLFVATYFLGIKTAKSARSFSG